MEDINKKEQSITEKIAKNYMAINISVLFLTIYVISFPFISIPIKKLVPSFELCPYLQMTGNPCPLCGGTRYFANILEAFHDIKYLWNPFGVMAIVIVLEFIFRVKNIIDLKRKKDCRRTIKIDIITTSIIVTAFFLYEIIYIILQK